MRQSAGTEDPETPADPTRACYTEMQARIAALEAELQEEQARETAPFQRQPQKGRNCG
jgi:hypothetical protein